MRLSRGWHGWYGLLLFWVGIATFCVIGAGALQVLGPVSSSGALARQEPEPAVNEFPSRVPKTFVAAATVPARVVDASENAALTVPDPEPAPAVASETTALADPAAPPSDTQSAMPGQKDIVPPPPPQATEVARHPAPRERTLHIRIVRDSGRCPKTMCYKWHLIQQRLKLARPPTLDMAELQLPASIREAAEKGEVELFVDAVERHQTIKGRDSVVIVARNLAGVAPGPGSFAALAASGP